MDTNILLESGTNELEVLEFTLGNNHYGINVAKIREILTYQPITPVPNAHPSIEGIFMPRERLITVIDLAKAYSSFYNENKIIVDDKDVQDARVYLTYAVSQVLKQGANLLGIEMPEKM